MNTAYEFTCMGNVYDYNKNAIDYKTNHFISFEINVQESNNGY